MEETPGGQISGRALDVFFLLDTSGSMSGLKIESLNTAMREVLPALEAEAAKNPKADVHVRAIKFDNSTRSHVARTRLKEFRWSDVKNPGGMTSFSKLFRYLHGELTKVPKNAYRPVFVLVSDGYPTGNYLDELEKLIADRKWFGKGLRAAISIGDAPGKDALKSFNSSEVDDVFTAKNPEHLLQLIHWVTIQSFILSQSIQRPDATEHHSSSGQSQPSAAPKLQPPPPPPFGDMDSNDDVF